MCSSDLVCIASAASWQAAKTLNRPAASMVSTAMLSLKKSTHTSKTNNLPNNLSEIASNFFDYANCTGLLQNQVMFAAAPFFF